MVKTTPPIHRVVVRHQASTAASGCWQASVGNPLKRECLQYIKRPCGYVQLHNDAIDQGRQKYKQSRQNQSTALNTTLQQRSRTQVPLIFTGTRPTLCHNKKRVHQPLHDQGRQKYKQSGQNQSTVLNTTLQQRSRTQVPLIFTGASRSQVAEQTHVRYKREAQQCPRPT
jgi:hypothetical protein